MATLSLSDIRVHYSGSAEATVEGFSLALASGEIACLLGASGCGKTTVLRAVAGFLAPDAGRIELAGETIADAARQQPPELRRIGMVFQDFALFPHLSVADNVAFGLRRGPAQLAPAERAARVAEALNLVYLQGYAERYPHELSGGQQQRVALARALAPRPRLLLLDEPFSSLDAELRESLSLELRALLKSLQMTAMLVTHDQREAFAMGDRIAVMRDGRIEQCDSAYRLYHRPATRFVADFVGEGCFIPARYTPVADGPGQLHTEFGQLPLPAGSPEPPDGPLDLLLRPDDVVHVDVSALRAKVLRRHFRGAEFLYELQLESGRSVLALVPSHHDHAIGESIGITLDLHHAICFPALQPPDPGKA